MEACAEVFAEVNIDARCQSGHVFLPHPAQEYSFWTRGTSQLMSVPGVFWTRPLAETVFPLKGILVVPLPPPKKNKLKKINWLMENQSGFWWVGCLREVVTQEGFTVCYLVTRGSVLRKTLPLVLTLRTKAVISFVLILVRISLLSAAWSSSEPGNMYWAGHFYHCPPHHPATTLPVRGHAAGRPRLLAASEWV